MVVMVAMVSTVSRRFRIHCYNVTAKSRAGSWNHRHHDHHPHLKVPECGIWDCVPTASSCPMTDHSHLAMVAGKEM
jgi:hypothetical protein